MCLTRHSSLYFQTLFSRLSYFRMRWAKFYSGEGYKDKAAKARRGLKNIVLKKSVKK